MASYLMIDETTRAQIAKVIAEAATQIRSYEALKREAVLLEHFGSPMSHQKPLVVTIPYGHMASFDLLEAERGRIFRHLCMSSPGDGPEPNLVAYVVQAFGFTRGLEACRIWTSALPGRRYAVHVMEPCDDGDWADAPAAASTVRMPGVS